LGTLNPQDGTPAPSSPLDQLARSSPLAPLRAQRTPARAGSFLGPARPLAISAQHGSYLGLSCRSRPLAASTRQHVLVSITPILENNSSRLLSLAARRPPPGGCDYRRFLTTGKRRNWSPSSGRPAKRKASLGVGSLMPRRCLRPSHWRKRLHVEGLSYRKISARLAAQGHVTGSKPHVASAIQKMLGR